MTHNSPRITPPPMPVRDLHYRSPGEDAAVRQDEIIEGEPRHAFYIQPALVAGLALVMIGMALVSRLVA